MFRLILSLGVVFFTLAGRAGTNECSYPFAPNAFAFSIPETGEEDLLANFKGFSNFLFLAEGSYPLIAKKVAQRTRTGKVVAGDITVMTEQEWQHTRMNMVPNLQQVYVDNSKRLPFANNSFDLIFMRKGLCHCNCTSTSCGGIQRNFSARRDFLSEVMRVLDVRSSKSLAFLHGVHGMTEDDVKEYQDAFASLEQSQSFELDVVRFPENGRFRAFRLRAKGLLP